MKARRAEGILTLDVQEYELCITAVEWYRLLAHGIRLGGSKIRWRSDQRREYELSMPIDDDNDAIVIVLRFHF
eukprot:scaffold9868_cov84-Skeletonema_marinoi.AAC.3